jgi:hypothetical protein
MVIALFLARLYVLSLALAGYLGGQLFFGEFSLLDSICGITATLTALASFVCSSRKSCQVTSISSAAIAGVCVMLGAVAYYLHSNVRGNDYAWELRLPFLICLPLIGMHAMAKWETLHGRNNSPEHTRVP